MLSFKGTFGITSSINITSLINRAYATKSIFVGNIAWQASNKTLREHFSKKVNVHSVSLPLDSLGRTKGFGFIEVEEEDYEKTFTEFEAQEFGGRSLYLKPANAPKPGF